jgi:hypothetical protein
VNGYAAIAAAVNELARWADEALAGGKPPKWVAQCEVERAREIAWAATLAADGKLAPGALDAILRPPEADGDTVMLPRRQPQQQAPGRHRGGRVARWVRGWIAWLRG